MNGLARYLALRDAIITTRIRIRDERRAIRIATGGDRAFAIRELAHYLALQRRQVARLQAIEQGE
jgi:hypothetical protein